MAVSRAASLRPVQQLAKLVRQQHRHLCLTSSASVSSRTSNSAGHAESRDMAQSDGQGRRRSFSTSGSSAEVCSSSPYQDPHRGTNTKYSPSHVNPPPPRPRHPPPIPDTSTPPAPTRVPKIHLQSTLPSFLPKNSHFLQRPRLSASLSSRRTSLLHERAATRTH